MMISSPMSPLVPAETGIDSRLDSYARIISYTVVADVFNIDALYPAQLDVLSRLSNCPASSLL